MHITLRQIRAFAGVGRHLSFTRAAEELNLSQPAVSMQVKQLESQIGQALYEQIGKKIYLTEAGREVYHYARAILGALGDMDAAIANLKGLDRGVLTLSIATTAHYFAPKLLSIFYARFPGVEVRLGVTNRQTLLQHLTENQVDMVIMGQLPKEMELDAGPFMENPLVVIAPPKHPFAKERAIQASRLANESFIVREKGSGTRGAMERFFKQHKIKLNTAMEVSSDEAIKQSVQAGLGLSIMSRDAVQTELELGRLIVPDVLHFPILRHWYVVHRKGKRLSPVSQAFKDFLLGEALDILKAYDET